MARNPRQINAVQELRTLALSGQAQTIGEAVSTLEAVDARATHVQLKINGGAVWITTDGSDPDPDAWHGMRFEEPVVLVPPVDLARRMRLVRDGGADAHVYYESKVH